MLSWIRWGICSSIRHNLHFLSKKCLIFTHNWRIFSDPLNNISFIFTISHFFEMVVVVGGGGSGGGDTLRIVMQTLSLRWSTFKGNIFRFSFLFLVRNLSPPPLDIHRVFQNKFLQFMNINSAFPLLYCKMPILYLLNNLLQSQNILKHHFAFGQYHFFSNMEINIDKSSRYRWLV